MEPSLILLTMECFLVWMVILIECLLVKRIFRELAIKKMSFLVCIMLYNFFLCEGKTYKAKREPIKG